MEAPALHSHHLATLPIQAAEPEAPAAGGEFPGWSWRRTSYPCLWVKEPRLRQATDREGNEIRLDQVGKTDRCRGSKKVDNNCFIPM